jgi:hypothetical protein
MLGNSSIQFDERSAWGSNVSWTLQMWQSDGVTPFVIAGHTFEYVVKVNTADTSSVIKLRSDVPGSPTPVGGGLLTVVTAPLLAAVQFTLYPPATTALVPPLQCYHALWMDYADPVNALNLFWGNWYLDPAIQP